MKKQAALFITASVYILCVLFFRYFWMPYLVPITEEWPFYLIRWFFYALAIGAANFFFYSLLSDFRQRAVPGFWLPFGLRIGLDAIIYGIGLLYHEANFIVRYMLDVVFIVLAGLSITWEDRKRSGWKPGKMTWTGWATILLPAAVLITLMVRMQADMLHIAHVYVRGSGAYNDSIGHIAMKAHFLSLAVSFFVQLAMVLSLIPKRFMKRLRPKKGFALYSTLSFAIFLCIIGRYIAYPAYVSDWWNTGSGYRRLENKHPFPDDHDFHYDHWGITFYRLNRAGKRMDEGRLISIKISDEEYQNHILIRPKEEMYNRALEVNGHTAFLFGPHGLAFYNGRNQSLILRKDILNQPKDDALVSVLKNGILEGDFHCFDYGAPYLILYAPEFIRPYLIRYAAGTFTEQEIRSMDGIRLEYVQEQAQKVLLASDK